MMYNLFLNRAYFLMIYTRDFTVAVFSTNEVLSLEKPVAVKSQ